MSPDVLIIICVGMTIIGFGLGFAYGRVKSPENSLNELRKGMSHPGYVAEMIAPGEHAEIVEVDREQDDPNPFSRAICLMKCQGCRYAGRYVIRA